MQRFARYILAVALLGATATPQPAAGQYTSREAACRYKVAQATRNYSAFVVERALLCHKQRIQGKLPAAIDCNDASTWAVHGFTRGVYLRAKDRAQHAKKISACHPDAAPLANLGYGANCPAPCGAIALNEFSDLGECALCLADDCMDSALTTAFGTTPLPATHAARKCVERTGRHLENYYNARSFMQQKCQMKKDRGYAGWVAVPDCGDLASPAHPYSFRMTAYRAKKSLVLERRCSDVDVAAETDTCGVDAASLVACTNAIAEQCTDQIFPQLMP